MSKVVFVLSLLVFCNSSFGALLVSYDMNTNTGGTTPTSAASTLVSGLTATNIRQSGFSNFTSTQGIGASWSFPSNAFQIASTPGRITGSDDGSANFFAVRITNSSAPTTTITQVSFTEKLVSTTTTNGNLYGAIAWAKQIGTNAPGTFTVQADTINKLTTAGSSFTYSFTLSTPIVLNTNESIQIRFLHRSDSPSTGSIGNRTTQFDDIQIFGSQVPEPNSAIVVGLLSVGGLMRRRLLRKS